MWLIRHLVTVSNHHCQWYMWGIVNTHIYLSYVCNSLSISVCCYLSVFLPHFLSSSLCSFSFHCIRICIYSFEYVYAHLKMYIPAWICICSFEHEYELISVYMCLFLYLFAHLNMCELILICMNSFQYVCVHFSMYILIWICVNSFEYVWTHLNMYILISI